MEQNIIYYFSGTGNSFKTAKSIANKLNNCRLVSMGKPHEHVGTYERIGFVFPTYAAGPPPVVEKYINKLDLSGNGKAHYFCVATCGGMQGNSLARIDKLLKNKGYILNYGKQLVMFSNCVFLYDMAKDPENKASASNTDLEPIISDIVKKESNTFPNANPLIDLIHNVFVSTFPNRDKGFRVSEECDGCGLCARICPVANVKMEKNKPSFRHGCQQCLACVQWCPRVAINYKNKTQKRGRYHHPGVAAEEMTGQAIRKKGK